MSSDEKALMELMQIMGGLPIPQMVYEWVIKTRQEAREEECQRILGLPSMEEMKMEGYTTQDAKSYHEGRNSLRRELKEDINKKYETKRKNRGVEDCVQSESIEWEKEWVEKKNEILGLFNAGQSHLLTQNGSVTLSAGQQREEGEYNCRDAQKVVERTEQFFLRAITTAVAKAGKKAYAEGFEDGCKAH